MTLGGKVALITGSTSGIGLGIAKRLVNAGCNVVLNGFGDPIEVRRIAAELASQHRVQTAYVPADVADAAAIRAMIAAVMERFGNLHILVNNAGVQHIAEIDVYPEDKWDQIVAVNLSAAFHATKAVLPFMKQNGWGRIVNIASAHGLVGSSGKCAYVAAKHGLIGLTKVTALENGRYGITANAICPGWTRTPLAETQIRDRAIRSGHSLQEEEIQVIGEKQAITVFTTPEQIGDLAVFLCSESASTVTGSSFSIDGGWVAQ